MDCSDQDELEKEIDIRILLNQILKEVKAIKKDLHKSPLTQKKSRSLKTESYKENTWWWWT